MNSANIDAIEEVDESIEMMDLDGEPPAYAELQLPSDTETEFGPETEVAVNLSQARGASAVPGILVHPRITIELDRMTYKLPLGIATKQFIATIADEIKKECNAEFHGLKPMRAEWKQGNPATISIELEGYEGPLPGENPPRTYSPSLYEEISFKAYFLTLILMYVFVVIVGFILLYFAYNDELRKYFE